LVIVAVKVTGNPPQVGFAPKVIAVAIVGEGAGEATVINITLLAAVVGFAQVALDVIVQDTISLFANVVVVKVVLLVPTFTLFTCH
jgi:hypothetical protein